MKSSDLKSIWQTLASNNIIEERLAEEQILAIISQKGNGVICKLQNKHRLDFNVYLAMTILIPIVMIFVLYWKNYSRAPEGLLDVEGHYLVPMLMEAFMIYALIRIRKNIAFLGTAYNTETLKESLVRVRSYFKKLSQEGFWIGTISLILILAAYQVNLLMSIGGMENLNFSFQGYYIVESWIFVFMLILMAGIPFIVKADTKKYRELLDDVDQTLMELSTED